MHPGAYMGEHSQVALPLDSVFGRMFKSVLESILGAYLDACVKQTGRVPSSAFGSILRSMPGGVHGRIMIAEFGE